MELNESKGKGARDRARRTHERGGTGREHPQKRRAARAHFRRTPDSAGAPSFSLRRLLPAETPFSPWQGLPVCSPARAPQETHAEVIWGPLSACGRIPLVRASVNALARSRARRPLRVSSGLACARASCRPRPQRLSSPTRLTLKSSLRVATSERGGPSGSGPTRVGGAQLRALPRWRLQIAHVWARRTDSGGGHEHHRTPVSPRVGVKRRLEATHGGSEDEDPRGGSGGPLFSPDTFCERKAWPVPRSPQTRSALFGSPPRLPARRLTASPHAFLCVPQLKRPHSSWRTMPCFSSPSFSSSLSPASPRFPRSPPTRSSCLTLPRARHHVRPNPDALEGA